jgi:hypothetical protein
MEKEKELLENKERDFRGEDFFPDEMEQDDQVGLSSPTWRGLVIAVVTAIVLSVTATFLLGGSFLRDSGASAMGCGPGSECCPPVARGK